MPVVLANNSYGGGTPSPAQNEALAELGEHGVVSVFASGNERSCVDAGGDSNVFPLNPYTVVVDASRPDSMPASFSNYGLKTDVLAPGDSIFSTVPEYCAQYFAPADDSPLI